MSEINPSCAPPKPHEDTSRPRYVCPVCGAVAYCKEWSQYGPRPTLKKMQRTHAATCAGMPEYRAGLLFGARPCGQASPEVGP
jgi:hypothetical protein